MIKVHSTAVDNPTGYHPPSITDEEIITMVERELPELAKQIQDPKISQIIMHQDAFAKSGYMGEFLLLGLAIKYIGIKDKKITIISEDEADKGEKELAEKDLDAELPTKD
jgi:hypothetical protein